MRGPDFNRIGIEIESGFGAARAAAGAVALVKAGQTRTFVYGDARLGKPVSPSTPFHICSCSKTFTAAVFSRLVQEGKVTWDTPVRTVVPEFKLGDPEASRLCTFHDLATLRVGLSRNGIAEWGIKQDLPRETRLARARHMEFLSPFRQRFSYSNLCYIALALAAERLADRPYSALLQERLCGPLGFMDSCSLGFTGSGCHEAAAEPCLMIEDEPSRVRELTGPNSEGSARMYLSARDAATWIEFLLGAIHGSDAGPLSCAAVRSMAAPHTSIHNPEFHMAPREGAACAYGRGLFVTQWHRQPLLHQGGRGRGWRHQMALAPRADAGVMVMAAAESPVVEALALQCLEMLTGHPVGGWRRLFTRAATALANDNRRALEQSFPVDCDATIVPPAEGTYANRVTGEVRILNDKSGLRFMPKDAPDFNATLCPLGGKTFTFAFDEPALERQQFDPDVRLQAGQFELKTTDFGRLERVT